MVTFLKYRSKYSGLGYGANRSIGFSSFNTRGILQVWDEIEARVNQNSKTMQSKFVSTIRDAKISPKNMQTLVSATPTQAPKQPQPTSFTVQADVHATQEDDPLVKDMINSDQVTTKTSVDYPSTPLEVQDIMASADDIVEDVAPIAAAVVPEAAAAFEIPSFVEKAVGVANKALSSPAAYIGASKIAEVATRPPQEPMSNLESKLKVNENFRTTNIVTGIASGAALGSEFGPIGAVVGAVAGGFLGDSGPVKIGTDVGTATLNKQNAIF